MKHKPTKQQKKRPVANKNLRKFKRQPDAKIQDVESSAMPLWDSAFWSRGTPGYVYIDELTVYYSFN